MICVSCGTNIINYESYLQGKKGPYGPICCICLRAFQQMIRYDEQGNPIRMWKESED